MHWQLATLALILLGFAAISGRVEGTSVTAPMVFTVIGIVVGARALDLIDLEQRGEEIKLLTEAALTVVLFSEASRIDLRALRGEAAVPARLLGIGLPLTLLAGFVVGVVNAVVWPALAFVVVPLSVLTLGLGAIVLNAVVVGWVLELLPGVEIDGFWPALAIVIGLVIVSTAISSVLALDDEAWTDQRASQLARKRAKHANVTEVPGVVFVQLDGVAYGVLRRALRSGDVPTLHRWSATTTPSPIRRDDAIRRGANGAGSARHPTEAPAALPRMRHRRAARTRRRARR